MFLRRGGEGKLAAAAWGAGKARSVRLTLPTTLVLLPTCMSGPKGRPPPAPTLALEPKFGRTRPAMRNPLYFLAAIAVWACAAEKPPVGTGSGVPALALPAAVAAAEGPVGPATAGGCGDGVCAPRESTATCPDDCPPRAGLPDGCKTSELPGCNSCGCETCVCAKDPYCCNTDWDANCIALCTEACGGCGGPPVTPGCVALAIAGCQGCACEACVCAKDAFCCQYGWDDQCAAECGGCGTACGRL